jgi:hypothetical protein
MSDYDTDLLRWSERQAALLRRAAAGDRVNDQVDWENVAEEIESLGESDRRELTNRIATILVHLVKLEASPADEPRTGWRETVLEQRRRITRLLKDSPSLRPGISQVIAEELADAKLQAAIALQACSVQSRVDPKGVDFTVEQALGPWLP